MPPSTCTRKVRPVISGTSRKQAGDGVAAIGREVLVGDAAHGVVGPRHVVEIVALRPQCQLELEPAALRFAADELQHLEVGVALLRRQVLDVDGKAIEREQERIGEVEVDVGDPRVVVGVVVPHAQRQGEAVEAVGREHGEVVAPLLAVMEPGLVLFLRAEQPRHRADAGGRLLDQGEGAGEGIVAGDGARPVGEFGKRVDQPAAVMPPGGDAVASADERQPLGDARQGEALNLGAKFRDFHQDIRIRAANVHGQITRGQGTLQLSDGPGDCRVALERRRQKDTNGCGTTHRSSLHGAGGAPWTNGPGRPCLAQTNAAWESGQLT